MNIRIRKLQYKIKKISNYIKFKIESFSFPKIIILSGVIIGFISLFLNNINSESLSLNLNFLNPINKYIGFISIFLFSVILFLLFSFNKKEKIKKTTNILLRDYILIIYFSILLFIISIINLTMIIGLKVIISDVYYGNGTIIYMISSIIIFVGALFLKNDYSGKQNTFLNESSEEQNKKIVNNTKLPF